MNGSGEHTDNDKKWVRETKDGHADAFEQLYRYYYPKLSQFTFRYVKSKANAEDLVHDVFHNVWKNRGNLDENGNIKSYLYTATRNRIVKFLNQKKERAHPYSGDLNLLRSESEDSENQNKEKEIEQAFQTAVEKLPESRRHVFLLSREDNLTYKEISQVLNISIKTVETQISRSLRYLRKELAHFFKKNNGAIH